MMIIAAESASDQFDVFYKILSLGVIGLAFLLAWLAFRLLKREQEKTTPSDLILNKVGWYMVFSFLLAFLGLVGEGLKMLDQKEKITKLAAEKSDLQVQVIGLTKDNHSLQTTNDGYVRLGEVWTIKGTYTIGEETPVVSDTEIEVTAHPPLVVIDPDVFLRREDFCPAQSDGSVGFS